MFKPKEVCSFDLAIRLWYEDGDVHAQVVYQKEPRFEWASADRSVRFRTSHSPELMMFSPMHFDMYVRGDFSNRHNNISTIDLGDEMFYKRSLAHLKNVLAAENPGIIVLGKQGGDE